MTRPRSGQAPLEPTGEVILYPAADGLLRVECRFAGESVWLTQALLAELYGKDVRTVNEHLQNLFEEGELDPGATIRKFRIVRPEGTREVSRLIDHYNLEAIRRRLPSASLGNSGRFPGSTGVN